MRGHCHGCDACYTTSGPCCSGRALSFDTAHLLFTLISPELYQNAFGTESIIHRSPFLLDSEEETVLIFGLSYRMDRGAPGRPGKDLAVHVQDVMLEHEASK